MLEEDFLGTLDNLELDHRDYFFQQENNPKHTCQAATTWFEENGVDVLPWAASSPDMSIIEHVWDHLDHMIPAL